jgi:hypothetical protein
MTSEKQFALAGIMVLLAIIIMPSYAQLDYGGGSTTVPSNAQQNQVQLTDKGSIKVGFYTEPAQPDTTSKTQFYISFLNKNSGSTQQHVDYKVFVKKGTDQIFGIPITHTAEGFVTVPFQFADVGTYQVTVEVDGILFQPISLETATFTVGIESSSVPEFPTAATIILVIGVFVVVSLNKMRIIPYN